MWRGCSHAIVIAFSLISIVAPTNGDDSELQTNRFVITPKGGLLVVPIKVFGEIRRFVLDTGASRHVFDDRLAHLLGQRIEERDVKTLGGRLDHVAVHECPEMEFGTFALNRNHPVCAYNLKKMNQFLDVDADGILGSPMLEDMILDIDFDLGLLQLHEKSTRPSNDWGRAMRILLDETGRPFVAARVSDVPIPLMLDTGSNDSIRINSGLFAAIDDAGGITSNDYVQLFTLGGNVRQRYGQLSSFTLGDFVHQGIRVTESSDDAIGLKYLARYRIRLDTSRRSLFLDKGLDYAAKRRIKSIGFGCCRANDRIEVCTVVAKSHAEDAGLHEGDIIRKVNGAIATLNRIRRKQDELQPITLEIERGGTIINITLTATDDVDPLAPTRHQAAKPGFDGLP